MANNIEHKNAHNLVPHPGQSDEAVIAQAFTSPTVRAATAVLDVLTFASEPPSLNSLVSELGLHVDAAQRGDLARPEEMLVAQAHTLDGLFSYLSRQASQIIREQSGLAETHLMLALKAQSQCRMTIETLSEIKNPRQVPMGNGGTDKRDPARQAKDEMPTAVPGRC